MHTNVNSGLSGSLLATRITKAHNEGICLVDENYCQNFYRFPPVRQG